MRNPQKSMSANTYGSENFVLPADLFVIPDDGNYILYAPFTKACLSVNGAALNLIREYQKGINEKLFSYSSLCEELDEAGILLSKNQPHSTSAQFNNANASFDPDGVSLLLTDKCTMRCSYCYSNGGALSRTMKWETAKAGLEWIVEHVRDKKRNRFFVSLHGGGEVTTALPLMKQCVEYARELASDNGLEVQIESGLNGVMPRQTQEWVAKNLNGATISLDGLPEVQNRQRPLANGKNSFELVDASLRYFDTVGFKYGIRTTVTGESLEYLVDSMIFIAQNYAAAAILVEPVFPIGRALAQDVIPPDPIEFVRQFRLANDAIKGLGKELKYSGARFGTLTNIFCKGVGNSFAITPDGEVTSCYEITDPSDERTGLFYYGKLNSDTGQFVFDQEKLSTLQMLTVENKTYCRNCFCKWHCAGDCPAKLAAIGDAWEPSTNPRCYVNRELTKDQIRYWLQYPIYERTNQ